MTDRERIIEGLEHCRIGDCVGCPYDQTREETLRSRRFVLACNEQLTEDVLSLLKEQEAVKPVRDTIARRFWVCGNCGEYVGFEDDDPFDSKEFDNYCRRCGKPVLWEGR